MWIVPKNKELSACVPDMAESSWDSSELARLFARSVMWRSKPSLARTWSQRLKRVTWMQRLSGRTLKPSLHKAFEEKYTASLAVIPASRLAVQDSEKEPTTPDTFGRILLESSRQLDLFGASSRTSPDTLPLDSRKFIEAYGIWVTKLRQDSLQRQRSVHLINESDCLSWLTPDVSDRRSEKSNQQGLSNQVNWPPPKQRDHKGKSQRGIHKPGDALMNMVELNGLLAPDSPSSTGKNRELWSTPEAEHQKGYHNQKNGTVIEKLGTQAGKGKLNPDWVEQLMGLEVGWTALDFSETGSSPNAQKRL